MKLEPADAEPTPPVTSEYDEAVSRESSVQPAEIQPADVQPTEAEPGEREQTGAQPTEIEQTGAQSTEAQSTGAQPAEVQPTGRQPSESTVETAVSIRTVPKYTRFLILGAGLGAAGTFILTASFPSDPAIGFGPLFGYFLIYGVPIGVVIGALAAIALDLIWRRRARTGIAAKTIVDPLPYDDDTATVDENSAANPAANPAADVAAPPATPGTGV